MAKIGIDLHVVDGKYQGSRSHVLEIFSRVIQLCPEIEFFLFLANPERLKEFSSNFTLQNVNLVEMPSANPVKRILFQLPRFHHRFGLNLLHTQYISPLFMAGKSIITLHDILFETYPEYFPLWFRWRSKLLMRLSALRARHIFTVSEFSKSDICSCYSIATEAVTVIYNGVDRAKFYPGKDGEDTLRSYGLLSGRYLFSVGRLEPRKNHISLVEAYAELNNDMPLVIIGQQDFEFQKIYKRIDQLGIKTKVVILSDISESELAIFYRHAAVFIYPSWAEGFGMPIIEAMASGVPVITSDSTSLLEIAGYAGLLISPSSVKEIVNAIDLIVMDKELRSRLIKDGLERVQRFDWNLSAQIVANRYRKILLEE